MDRQDRRFECLKGEGENGGPGVVFSSLLGGARINAVAASAVQNLPVLHDPALGENDDLAATTATATATGTDTIAGRKPRQAGKELRRVAGDRKRDGRIAGKRTPWERERCRVADA